ncbi:DUF6508 domain-containing protein [Rhodococcoides kroppenstedtii]|uniref:DUF6508 domain-containing protein n=1 Tax=Rhodococcoides kroppenstedtii TaxID=293050 RepID=UPI0028E8AABD|nr:DUF6508 domain-containing protein [Rhodococcus kroppenstedtii]
MTASQSAGFSARGWNSPAGENRRRRHSSEGDADLSAEISGDESTDTPLPDPEQMSSAFDRVDPHPTDVLLGWDETAWQQLDGLLERCAAHRGAFGEWVRPAPGTGGVVSVGYPREDALVGEVRQFFYDHGAVLHGLKWMNWDAGHRLLEAGPEQWHHLPADVLFGLITLITRRDRFSEGTFMAAFDDGSLPFLLGQLGRFRETPAPPAALFPVDWVRP